MAVRKIGKTAFIFLGNSTGSAFDIGVAKVLFRKIKPDYVFGTSMGSLNVAFILKDKNVIENIKKLEEHWKTYNAKKIFKINPEIFYKLFFAKSIFTNKGMKEAFGNDGGLNERKIEDCAIPLYIGAYDNTNKTTALFHEGSLLDAVMASCASPPFFPPYKVDGIEYLDGGINGRACVDKAIELGCKRIFFINAVNKSMRGNNILSAFKTAVHIMKIASIEHLLDSKLKSFFIDISPDKNKIPAGFTNLNNTELLIKHGEEKAKEILENLGY